MEETLKKALRTGIQTLISVTEEVRHGLTILENDIQALSRRIGESKAIETGGEKLDELIERSIQAIREYERRATRISQQIQQYLAQVDPMARQSVVELAQKLQALSQKLTAEKEAPPQP
jgi:tRNA(Phe) wybutosine-synthesizing methylase Tyw3